jgi:membrane protease subunit HflC
MRNLVILGIVVIVALIVLSQALYVVDVTEQVLVTRFGDPRTVATAPGLYFKAPVADTVLRFDRRVLRIDAQPVSMPDIDKQNLTIDSYARYKIVDPLKFFKTLQNENTAATRIGDVVTSSLRDEIAVRQRTEIIGAKPLVDPVTEEQLTDEEGLPLIEATESRTELLEIVFDAVQKRVEEGEFGIQIIDVRLKRADFSDRVQETIFNRMRAERNKIATRLRSEGDEQDLRIRAEANKNREIILAAAEQESNEIRGLGEAEAIGILADALNRDPEFFAFRRTLEAYPKFLNQQTTVILSSDADIFKYLQEPPGQLDLARE